MNLALINIRNVSDQILDSLHCFTFDHALSEVLLYYCIELLINVQWTILLQHKTETFIVSPSHIYFMQVIISFKLRSHLHTLYIKTTFGNCDIDLLVIVVKCWLLWRFLFFSRCSSSKAVEVYSIPFFVFYATILHTCTRNTCLLTNNPTL